jgi:ornithine cyclodeaminase/alanine dehydrogenase-like protein (mu-crystallin family)
MSTRLNVKIAPTEKADDCLACDIVVAATSSATPVFDGSRLRPGTHINAIGSHSPNARELDTEAIRRSTVVADYKLACLAEAGDLLLPIQEGVITEAHVVASIGEIAAGSKPGRKSKEEITLFKSVGLAVEDAASAGRVYELAKARGVGKEIEV